MVLATEDLQLLVFNATAVDGKAPCSLSGLVREVALLALGAVGLALLLQIPSSRLHPNRGFVESLQS